MNISRTPFRISFAGGGSDLPSYYKKYGGAVLSTSINKYIYIAIHPFFDKNKIQLKYSNTELVSDFDEIQHPIFKEILLMNELKGIDINSIADIPSGTGLGSSSSFTVGLLNAINAYKNKSSSYEYLAKTASYIEINKLASPIGKQDQYAAAYGGLNFITFNSDDTVKVDKIIMDPVKKNELDSNLILIYTGNVRSANSILKDQNLEIRKEKKIKIQKKMVDIAFNLKIMLENNKIDDFGSILHEGWLLKKSLTNKISNEHVDQIYNEGINAGALGGKLLGAGGQGFILFYCPNKNKNNFRIKMRKYNELNFKFDNDGSKIIYNE
jgi:D-glycero-alpha-D-manno-heptose-7-phosphate kinase